MQLTFVEAQRFVSDLGKARTFYEGVLGLSVKRANDRYVVYHLGGCDLVVCGGATTREKRVYGQSVDTAISFVTHDLEAVVAALAARGVPIVHQVAASAEGRLVVIQDPDGHFVEIIQ